MGENTTELMAYLDQRDPVIVNITGKYVIWFDIEARGNMYYVTDEEGNEVGSFCDYQKAERFVYDY